MLLFSHGLAGSGSWGVTGLSCESSTWRKTQELGVCGVFLWSSVERWCEGSDLAACAIRVEPDGLLIFPLFVPELLCFALWHHKLITSCFSCLQEVSSLPLSLPSSSVSQ